MSTSLHIAPVGLDPCYNNLYGNRTMGNSQALTKIQFVTGLSPIPALTCPDTPELGLPSSHSYGYGFQSRPAFSRICPASAPWILVQHAGYWHDR